MTHYETAAWRKPEELASDEIESVSGGGVVRAIGYALGYALGSGAQTMQSIDSMGNSMLSAMQYGA